MTDHPHDRGRPRRGGADRDAAFADRVARPLRASDPLDETFEARVMSAVHAEVRRAGGPRRAGSHTGWWRRPRTVQLSPLAALALAAGIAAVALIGQAGVRAATARAPRIEAPRVAVAPARTDTVHVVRFVVLARDARSVSLVGDFNDWSKDATPLHPGAAAGAWVASVVVPAGRHEYAFVVHTASGDRWMADPFAGALHHDEFGTESSIVTVGAAAGAASAGSS